MSNKKLRVRYEWSSLFAYLNMFCWYCGRRCGYLSEVSGCTWAWTVFVPGETTTGFSHTELGAKRAAVRELKRQIADRAKWLAAIGARRPQQVRGGRKSHNRKTATGNH